jgi:hypothetical protein
MELHAHSVGMACGITHNTATPCGTLPAVHMISSRCYGYGYGYGYCYGSPLQHIAQRRTVSTSDTGAVTA